MIQSVSVDVSIMRGGRRFEKAGKLLFLSPPFPLEGGANPHPIATTLYINIYKKSRLIFNI